jgi:hypothetical protein
MEAVMAGGGGQLWGRDGREGARAAWFGLAAVRA